MNGSIAIGSRRTTPTAPLAAAVVSLPSVAPTYTPCIQLNAWKISGSVFARRPPKIIAEISTPFGSFAASSSTGLFAIGAVNRLFGWAAFVADPAFHGLPVQSMHSAGGWAVFPSHHTSPSGNNATFVKIVSCDMHVIAFGFVSSFVPGTTPKYPASGLIARRRPDFSSTHIHA